MKKKHIQNPEQMGFRKHQVNKDLYTIIHIHYIPERFIHQYEKEVVVVVENHVFNTGTLITLGCRHNQPATFKKLYLNWR